MRCCVLLIEQLEDASKRVRCPDPIERRKPEALRDPSVVRQFLSARYALEHRANELWVYWCVCIHVRSLIAV